MVTTPSVSSVGHHETEAPAVPAHTPATAPETNGAGNPQDNTSELFQSAAPFDETALEPLTGEGSGGVLAISDDRSAHYSNVGFRNELPNTLRQRLSTPSIAQNAINLREIIDSGDQLSAPLLIGDAITRAASHPDFRSEDIATVLDFGFEHGYLSVDDLARLATDLSTLKSHRSPNSIVKILALTDNPDLLRAVGEKAFEFAVEETLNHQSGGRGDQERYFDASAQLLAAAKGAGSRSTKPLLSGESQVRTTILADDFQTRNANLKFLNRIFAERGFNVSDDVRSALSGTAEINLESGRNPKVM
ncbi:MAG: hypothetical protein AAFW47_00410 [Pseudomonadota bacterium]